jgi:hypothetical protein
MHFVNICSECLFGWWCLMPLSTIFQLFVWLTDVYTFIFQIKSWKKISFTAKGPSWPWSHGSWIYNYQCNRCLSSHMLWVRLPLRVRCTTLFDKVCQWLVATVDLESKIGHLAMSVQTLKLIFSFFFCSQIKIY